MSATVLPIRGRWGYFPLPHATYLKLKLLHKAYWQALYDFHRWHRWWRKQPQNRVGPEPTCCAAFIVPKAWYKKVCHRGVDGYKVYPKQLSDHGVQELYRQARRPSPEPVAAFTPELVASIDALFDRVAQLAEPGSLKP